MSCTFCQVAERQIAADVVYEDERFIAFLDHRPLFPGHVLLIPRQHYETLDDLPAPLAGPLMLTVQLLARAVQTAMQAEGTFIAINNRVSQSVPHLHVHVVPRRRRDGLKGFFWPRHSYPDDAEKQSIVRAIRSNLKKSEA